MSTKFYIDTESKTFAIQPESLTLGDTVDIGLFNMTESDMSANTVMSLSYKGDIFALAKVKFINDTPVFKLNLETQELASLFAGKSDNYIYHLNILIVDQDDNNVILNAMIAVVNSPEVPDNLVLKTGKSAYEIWLEQGNVGTKDDFFSSLPWIDSAVKWTKANYQAWINLVADAGHEPEYYTRFKPGVVFCASSLNTAPIEAAEEITLNQITFDNEIKAPNTTASAVFLRANQSHINIGMHSSAYWESNLFNWQMDCYVKPTDYATGGTIISFYDARDMWVGDTATLLFDFKDLTSESTPPQIGNNVATWNDTDVFTNADGELIAGRWVIENFPAGNYLTEPDATITPFSLAIENDRFVLKYHNNTFTSSGSAAVMTSDYFNNFIPLRIVRTDDLSNAAENTKIEIWIQGQLEPVMICEFDAKYNLTPHDGIWLGSLPYGNGTSADFWDGHISDFAFTPNGHSSVEYPIIPVCDSFPLSPSYQHTVARAGEITTIPAGSIYMDIQTGELFYIKRKIVIDKREG